MVNTRKLKGLLVEKGISVEGLAKAIGLNKSTLYRKLNGRCPVNIKDADLIARELQLSGLEASEIFFSQLVADTRKIIKA
jgi:transcriptional regulator with XRE-family HTH domain